MPQNRKYSDLEKRIVNIEERVDAIENNSGNIQTGIVSYTNKTADKVELGKDMIKFPSNEDIQVALKNAGLYDGVIDGKIGTKTRNAIKEFQKQNDLETDGVVGRNTWGALSKFYYAPAEGAATENKKEASVKAKVSD
ncbi:MAG: peptidoglycan-binding domain-containing protein [Candidatus Omnitrophica bacterium]|nr:peptidoglycan-binding domain-containing protein [Candidatus Omnitrophota bacterium]